MSKNIHTSDLEDIIIDVKPTKHKKHDKIKQINKELELPNIKRYEEFTADSMMTKKMEILKKYFEQAYEQDVANSIS